MRFPTKQKRLVAMFDAYCKIFKKTAVSVEEVSVWALETGLYPVPARGADVAICNAWEKKLDALTKKAVPQT